MKDHHAEGMDIVTELEKLRLTAETPGLRNRVLCAGREAWTDSSMVFWAGPVLHFAASLTVALLLIVLSHQAQNRELAAWGPTPDVSAVSRTSVSPWMAERPWLVHLAAARSTENASHRFLERNRQLKEMLQGMENDRG